MALPQPGPRGPDLYRLLNVPRDASGEDITRAYRRRARALHPDSRPADSGAPAQFRALADAYHVLSDQAARAAYDRTLHRPAGQAPDRTARDRPAGPALWAGPVHVSPASGAAGRNSQGSAARAILAALLTRHLADSPGGQLGGRLGERGDEPW